MSQPHSAHHPEQSATHTNAQSTVVPAGWDVISTDGESMGLSTGFAAAESHEATHVSSTDLPGAASPIQATCEECGNTSDFPAEKNGSIQKCPSCEEWMDVGGEDWFDEAEAAGHADDYLALLPPLKGCGCGPGGCK